MARLTLVTRPGCHLCEEAARALDRIGEPWTELNVESDIELEREYGDRVPVVLLDGREHGYWRVAKRCRSLAQISSLLPFLPT